MSSEGAARGFTLLEVMIALAVLGLALAAIYAVMSDSFDRMEASAARFETAAIAEALLAEAVATRPLIPGEASGVTSGGIRWRLAITRESSSLAGGAAAYRINLTVEGSGVSITRTAWRAGPTE